jgi:thymidylate synthase
MDASPTARFSVIVAHAPDFGIGRANALLFEPTDPDCRIDLAHFRAVTSHVLTPGRLHAVVMGYNTFVSLGRKPLRGRVNIVVTRAHQVDVTSVTSAAMLAAAAAAGGGAGGVSADATPQDTDTAPPLHVAKSLTAALQLAAALPNVDRTFVIGGAQLYKAAAVLAAEGCDYVYVTRVAAPCRACSRRHAADTACDSDDLDTSADDVASPALYTSGATTTVMPFWLAPSTCTLLHSSFLNENMVLDIYGGVNRNGASATANTNADDHDDDARILPDVGIAYRWPAPFDHDEFQYLRLVWAIVNRGQWRENRTGVPTLALFGAQLRFSLRNWTLPLLTTKRVPFEAVKKELMLLFMPGATDEAVLRDSGVRIWEANARAFAAARKAAAEESSTHADADTTTRTRTRFAGDGDLGPIYGFQWRHFGAPYAGCDVDYTGQGVDQLAQLVHALTHDPHSRRHILCAWNPAQQHDMALPPCHVMAQFYVGARGTLTCKLTQRSADVGLGLPFNIASYALLTHLLARATGLTATNLILDLGDTHVYTTHEGALLLQLSRRPRGAFPTLAFAPGAPTDLFAIRPEHVDLVDYVSHGPLPMPMAV